MRAVNMLLVSLLLISGVVGNDVNKIKPRAFGRRYTKTVIKPHVITSFIPSSCVLVDATLPPCRTLRGLKSFPIIEPRSMLNDSSINTSNDLGILQEPAVQTTPLSWGEYLGIYAPTVTVTSTQLITTTVVDPEVQVTYAIRGCRPKSLPANMDRCDTSGVEAEDSNFLPTFVNDVIQPTSTLLPLIISETANSTTGSPILIQLEGSGSTTEQELSPVNTPTKGLDEVTTVNL